MAKKRFPSNGSGTFSDNLVGNQKTSDNAFTQSNFSTEGTPVQRDSRNFTTPDFSKPISLDDLNTEENIEKLNELFDQSLKIKFNTEKGSKDLFGSAFLRAKVAVGNIANKFPASLRVNSLTTDAKTVDTAYDVIYDGQFNVTKFKIPYNAIRNPFGIEYTKKGLSYVDSDVDEDRNFSKNYTKYVVFYQGKEYKITKVNLPEDVGNGVLGLTVEGDIFSGLPTKDQFYIKLNDLLFEKKFELMDDFEQLLLDRETTPLYTSKFTVPKEASDGSLYFGEQKITWELEDDFNILISGTRFEVYLEKLFETCEVIDNYKANLIARFLTTASLQEFDTQDQKVKKVFQLYGRFFDDVKKFIDNIAYMNNVTYDKINNVPDLLLKNLAELLGMDVITSINEKNIEEYLYKKKDSQFEGVSKGKTPFETDIEIYRRIVLNSAYLYKSKGTRKPLRFLMNFIGAPESFIEINEYVYKVVNRIDYEKFSEKLDQVIDGLWFEKDVVFNNGKHELTEESIDGEIFNIDDYPIKRLGQTDNTVPKRPEISNDYYFQKGAGWFERTDDHRSLNVLDEDRSDLTSSPKVIKTKFEDFTYGEKYFERYRTFPNFDDGWELTTEIDNKKSSPENNEFILNRKNVDIFLNPGRAVLYDFVRTYQNHTLTYSGILLNNFNFAQFADYGFWHGVEVGKGKYGKKYWDLINLFKDYYNSGLGKEYDYEKTYSYLNKISTYWIKLIEQFVPATTLWFTGEKIENHNLHRPKFNWEEPCRNDVTTLDLSLKKSLYDILIDALTKYKNIPDCYERIYRYGNWYFQIKINGKVYTLDYDGWNHFFTSTESEVMGSCNNENAGPGTVDECYSYDNPIYMLCDFENFINCYPDECEDFVTAVVNMLDQISVTIFNDEIKPKICDDTLSSSVDSLEVPQCGFTDGQTVENGRAFEIEGFKGGENCYDCNNEIKLISNNFCGECFEIDSIEVGLQVIINEGDSPETHDCFVLSNTPFSIDYSRFGGIQYDVNRPEHHVDLLDPRGTMFLTRYFMVEKCCDDDQPYHGKYEYIGLMDPVDRYPVYKHETEDIYLSAYPDAPESTTGSFMFTQGPKESYTEIYGRLDEVSLLDFTNVFTHNTEWIGDECITLNDIGTDIDVVRHRYAIGDEIGVCERVNDDGFDYIKLWLHGGTYEAQDGSDLPYEVVFDCHEEINEGEEIWYDSNDDVFIIKISSGVERIIHAYDQSGSPINIYIKERVNHLVCVEFESGIESVDGYGSYGSYGSYVSYGGYGQYGSYSGYGGYFCYGNEFLYYSNINPYCSGIVKYDLLEECQGYEVDTEMYKVTDPLNNPITNVDEIIVGENVDIVRVQDLVEGDQIIVAYPDMGEIDYCDYSAFYYGDESVVCNYTENIGMSEITFKMCGRIYKYVNINEGRVKLEYYQNVLVMEDMNKTNSNDLLTLCSQEASKEPIKKITNSDGTMSVVYYDNEYRVISKPSYQISEGDFIITTNQCGVIQVESVVYDDYCNEGLYVDKYNVKFDRGAFAWYRPKNGYDTIYVNDGCVPYCDFNPSCLDDFTYDICEDPTTTTSTTQNCVDDITYQICIDDVEHIIN